jgi:formiminoglutamase
VDHLRPLTPGDLRALTAVREGETRLGERLETPGADGALPAGTRAAVLGVPEDVGVRANLGRPGARRTWRAFLPRFVNMQSNAFLEGSRVAVAGCVEVRDIRRSVRGIDPAAGGPKARAAALAALREATARIDERVASVVEAVRRQGAVPIVVGGGHNNAFGILAGCARARGGPMACVNVDLHADLRPLEGRHSGNGFTAARAAGYLGRYAVLGLAEAFATQAIVETIERDPETVAVTFESMLRGQSTLASMAAAGIAHVAGAPATLELDLDAVAQAPASAAAASGFTAAEFRAVAMRVAAGVDLQAVHVAEGAPGRGPWPDEMLGKLVAELVRDAACAACARPFSA